MTLAFFQVNINKRERERERERERCKENGNSLIDSNPTQSPHSRVCLDLAHKGLFFVESNF